MAVVVSDTTPLHYLILVEQEFILERLYSRIIIPSAVLEELRHPSAPAPISAWASHMPGWVKVATPKSIPARFDALDLGERQALALANEINADLILVDDKLARRVAVGELMKVKGTLGVVAQAAKAGLLNFTETLEKLKKTSMHLNQDVVDEVIREIRRSSGQGAP